MIYKYKTVMASDIHNLVMYIAGHHGFIFIYHCGWLCVSLAITVLYLYIIVVGYVYRWPSRFYIYISLWLVMCIAGRHGFIFIYHCGWLCVSLVVTVLYSDTHNQPQ
jgi:hypothetical protein